MRAVELAAQMVFLTADAMAGMSAVQTAFERVQLKAVKKVSEKAHQSVVHLAALLVDELAARSGVESVDEMVDS